MTNLCQQCRRPEPHAYLCESCATQLANMLAELPWLIEELDNRIQQLARITHGTIGRQRRPAELNAIDFDAAETARKVRKTLLHWVTEIAQKHNGRTPPALNTVHTKHLARWLLANVDAITRLDLAHRNHKGHTTGHRLYHDIAQLTGTPTDPQGGQLHHAINRHEKNFAGPCPTVVRRGRRGEPIECATILYADIDQATVQCPTCHHHIDVEENQKKARKDRDLVTKQQLLEALADIDEPVPAKTLDQWIRARRLRRRGWLHNGEFVAFRIHADDPALYSLDRARKLRARDRQLTDPRHALADQ